LTAARDSIHLQVVPAEGEPFEHPFEGDSMVIGRAGSCDLVLADRFLSRRHARLYREGDEVLVEDLGSRNGTWLNGRTVEQPTPLRIGDQLRLCGSSIRISGGLDETADLARSRVAISTSPDDSPGAHTVFRSATELLSSFTAPQAVTESERDALRRQAARLALLNEIHRALARSATLDELLEMILDRVMEHLAPEEAVIFLAEDDGGYRCAASRQSAWVDDDYMYSQTLIREVSEKGLAALVLDTRTDKRFDQAESLLDSGIRSLVAAPLLYPDGSLGMIALSSRSANKMFSENDMELLNSLASVAALRIWNVSLVEEAAERHRMERELALARRIQESLLAESVPAIAGHELVVRNRPSRGVSGDFYRVTERLDGGECVLMVADVSGKGMAASLLTATLEALMAQPIADGRSAVEILTALDPLLESRTPPEQFATVFLGVLETATGRLTYASAGHNPALLLGTGGEVRELGRTGLPLGLLGSAAYEPAEARLDPGEILVIYTDGITEAMDPGQNEYGFERLVESCRARCAQSASRLAEALEADLEAFTDGEPLADDQTLMVVRRLA
jgi:pSer/pThr/pTyr-binding forkhead associated (FHA) protein